MQQAATDDLDDLVQGVAEEEATIEWIDPGLGDREDVSVEAAEVGRVGHYELSFIQPTVKRR
jgi:hypothetical protein